MKKELRQKIFDKYNGLCAYTGNPLGGDWQVDHKMSIRKANFIAKTRGVVVEYNSIDNLVPTIGIINHYKRGLDLDGFRSYMMEFHIRLSRLPKNTKVERTKNRIKYMNEIASLFDITPDKPFNGKFYFETIFSS